ncbi:MAG: hypothetical protein JJE50_15875 [Actinomycetales bacterium]|nr:hypothetical protein [Actinomycetales bacterium]
MSDQTLRERAIRALAQESWQVFAEGGHGDVEHTPWRAPEPRESDSMREASARLRESFEAKSARFADAVLAVVADAPGLVEALEKHRLNTDGYGDEMCQAEDWTEYQDDTYEAHLADVVRAWLR